MGDIRPPLEFFSFYFRLWVNGIITSGGEGLII